MLMRTKRNTHVKGFTLVELLMVLAIIAIVSGIVVPNLRGSLKGVRVREAALVLAEHLRYAQMLAVDSQRPVRVTIDRERGRYRVESATSLVGLEFQPAAGMPAEGGIGLPEGVEFTKVEFAIAPDGNKDLLWFEPYGAWSSGKLWLSDNARTVQVRVGHAIGHIHVVDLSPEATAPDTQEHADLLSSPM